MIDLTPLDIRSKRGDFARGFRGYDPGEVDHFLELVADQVEALMRKNATLAERTERLTAQVEGLEARERAVQEALVTAQELRREITAQAQREAESVRGEGERVAGALRDEAERDARALRERAQRRLEEVQREIDALERTRFRALKAFRTLLERALDGIEAEEAVFPEVGLPGPPSSDGDEPGDGRADERVVDRIPDSETERPAVEDVRVPGAGTHGGDG